MWLLLFYIIFFNSCWNDIFVELKGIRQRNDCKQEIIMFLILQATVKPVLS